MRSSTASGSWSTRRLSKRKTSKPRAVRYRSSLQVCPSSSSLQVLRAVHFYDKLCGRRVKVNNIVADRLLPIKLDAQDLFVTEPRPKGAFAVCHVSAQMASVCLVGLIIAEHELFLRKIGGGTCEERTKSPLGPLFQRELYSMIDNPSFSSYFTT